MSPIKAIIERFTGCSHACQAQAGPAGARVILVGSPNVGKSALFNRLTGRYVTVSNYPGTTVEISTGRCRTLADDVQVVDTPGMYSLAPISEEERVARDVLLEDGPTVILHVIDAKNIQRMIGLTIQLAGAGANVALVLNMIDEADNLGIKIDCAELSSRLGVPVVATSASTGRGIAELLETIRELLAVAPGRRGGLKGLPTDPQDGQSQQVHCEQTMALRTKVDEIVSAAVEFPPAPHRSFRERLSQFCMNPWTGLPLLAVVLYFGVYKFVGLFGAGVCVEFLEHTVFGQYVNPHLSAWIDKLLPWSIPVVGGGREPVAGLFTGEYGIITLGLRYAVAIILPVVGTFFLAFSVLEDSGYLPRLAMLIDRLFKTIGLSGRAVIPMVLGFGCDTMATMVTRTLETRRERVIATILLALAIPCSAQLGLILALLAQHPRALALWAAVVMALFLLVGLLAARVLPGKAPSFHIELPPLRWPRPANIAVKTYTRIAWYFKEILPMFIIASVLIWVGKVTGAFQALVTGIEPLVRALGLPDKAAFSFLFGFFRRDYGAAGLYDMQHAGLLNGNQLAVAAVTLTLFLPCIAQFLIMKKERGLKVTLAMSAFICVVAFGTGLVLNVLLNVTGVKL